MKTLLIKITALLFVVSMLAGCEPPEPTVFGVPQSQWYTLTKAQQNQVIASYNRQQEINAQNAPTEAAIAVAGAAIIDEDGYYDDGSYRYRHDYYRRHGYYPPYHRKHYEHYDNRDQHDNYDDHGRHNYHPEPPRPGPMPLPPRPVPPTPTPIPYDHGHHERNSIPVIFPHGDKKYHHAEDSIPVISKNDDKKSGSDFKSLIPVIQH